MSTRRIMMVTGLTPPALRRHVRFACFWKLSQQGLLPQETQDYVPKVLGTARAWKTMPQAAYPVAGEMHRVSRRRSGPMG